MTMENIEEKKRQRAKKRVEKIKGLYVHFSIYIVINTFILVNIQLNMDDFWRWSHFITLFGWGIGIAFHAARAFRFNPFFGKKWEERQIQKYIDEDKKEMGKYR